MSAAALIGVIIMSAVFCQAAQVHAKSENIKTRLVSRVVISSYDSQSKKWTKDRRTSFAYKKAYPVKKVDYYYDGKTKSKETYKYTFLKNGNPKKMLQYDNDGRHTSTRKYRIGLVRNINFNADGIESKEVFQYGAGKYLTIKIHEEVRHNISEDNPDMIEYADEIDYMNVKTRKGLLKKTVNHGIFANWDNTETPKNWSDFMGTYTARYNKYGIIKDTYAKFSKIASSSTGKQNKFVMKVKDGVINSVIKYEWNNAFNKGKGRWEPASKYTFKYAKTKISPYRYSQMMSNILMEQNNYYEYLWY